MAGELINSGGTDCQVPLPPTSRLLLDKVSPSLPRNYYMFYSFAPPSSASAVAFRFPLPLCWQPSVYPVRAMSHDSAPRPTPVPVMLPRESASLSDPMSSRISR